MSFAFGDIYLTQFDPSSGHEYKKLRPAIVIQEKETALTSPYITVVPITSRLDKLVPPDFIIQKDTKNRLLCDSVVKVRHISSFDRKRFVHFIGKANSPVIRKIRGYLRRHFGL